MKRELKNVFATEKPIIGMVHLRPLPGSPGYDPVSMGMDKILENAVEEAKKLECRWKICGISRTCGLKIWDMRRQQL